MDKSIMKVLQWSYVLNSMLDFIFQLMIWFGSDTTQDFRQLCYHVC